MLLVLGGGVRVQLMLGTSQRVTHVPPSTSYKHFSRSGRDGDRLSAADKLLSSL